jgi:hypothetical protein
VTQKYTTVHVSLGGGGGGKHTIVGKKFHVELWTRCSGNKTRTVDKVLRRNADKVSAEEMQNCIQSACRRVRNVLNDSVHVLIRAKTVWNKFNSHRETKQHFVHGTLLVQILFLR